MPENVKVEPNGERFNEVMNTIEKLKNHALLYDEGTTFEISQDALNPTTLCFSIITSLFVIQEMEQYWDIAKHANCVDAAVLEDGNMEISFSFQKAWKLK